jgi:polygalacturonase
MTGRLGKVAGAVLGVAAGFVVACAAAFAAEPARFDIAEHGAIGDGAMLNTHAIQSAIDQCAAGGGGTIVVPKGEFVTGSLFLKPGVNLELLEGAVLKGSANADDYEVRPGTRFEGHFAEWRSGLLNAEHADHLRITGPGMLDGNGPAYWSTKTAQGRPRLCAVRDSTDVVVSGVHFMRSASWNLHFYNCRDVTVENSRMELLDTDKGPATDGTDIDSCQNVTIRDCFYSVNDDCIALKGNRYDGLDQEPASPPVANVHIINCTFVRGMGALTLGTEATKINDVEMEHCTVSGNIPMLRLKMRPDTPGQDYQNVSVHDIALDGRGPIFSFELTHGTKVAPRPPRAVIRHISVSDIHGTYGSLGTIASNANTDITDVSLKDINVKVTNTKLNAAGVNGLMFENVNVNDMPMSTEGLTAKP